MSKNSTKVHSAEVSTETAKDSKMKDYFRMTMGVILLTCGVYFFKIPNGFSTGGVSGMGTLLGKITPMSPASWISLLNTSLLILGFLVLGRSTGIRTVYCSLMFSGLTQVLEWIVPLNAPLTNEPFLELCYAMFLTAFGSAMIFRANASSGGTDIVALILKKHTDINVGKALLYVDFFIAFSSFFIFGIATGLFSMAGLFAKAYLVDSVLESMDSCKYFIVVTGKSQEISDYILKKVHHGATIVKAQGAYTGDDKVMIHTVVRRIQAIQLRKKIKEIDPSAFIIVSTSSEIIGRGFRGV